MSKRKKEFVSKDDYYMGLAFIAAATSSTIKPQGAILVNAEDRVVGMGRTEAPTNLENEHLIHAEMNSILNVGKAEYGTLYVTHTPCYNCIMAILASKIKRVVYFENKKLDDNSQNVINVSHTQIVKYTGNINWMRDYLKTLKIQDIFV